MGRGEGCSSGEAFGRCKLGDGAKDFLLLSAAQAANEKREDRAGGARAWCSRIVTCPLLDNDTIIVYTRY